MSASLSLACWRAEASALDLLEGSSGSWTPQGQADRGWESERDSAMCPVAATLAEP